MPKTVKKIKPMSFLPDEGLKRGINQAMSLMEGSVKGGRRLSYSDFVKACIRHCLYVNSSFTAVETDLVHSLEEEEGGKEG